MKMLYDKKIEKMEERETLLERELSQIKMMMMGNTPRSGYGISERNKIKLIENRGAKSPSNDMDDYVLSIDKI